MGPAPRREGADCRPFKNFIEGRRAAGCGCRLPTYDFIALGDTVVSFNQRSINPMSQQDPSFNPADVVAARLVYLLRFFLFLTSLGCGVVAVTDQSWKSALFSAGALAAVIISHRWLVRSGKLEACDRALDRMFNEEPGTDPADEFEVLLQRRASLEEKRGTPGFDPWEVQALRREISDYVREHPDAARRFDEQP